MFGLKLSLLLAWLRKLVVTLEVVSKDFVLAVNLVALAEIVIGRAVVLLLIRSDLVELYLRNKILDLGSLVGELVVVRDRLVGGL
jgi:hypothetical protein